MGRAAVPDPSIDAAVNAAGIDANPEIGANQLGSVSNPQTGADPRSIESTLPDPQYPEIQGNKNVEAIMLAWKS